MVLTSSDVDTVLAVVLASDLDPTPVVTQNERALDYLAILFSHALMWEGLRWSPGAIDAIKDFGREWKLSTTLVDIAIVHKHVSIIRD